MNSNTLLDEKNILINSNTFNQEITEEKLFDPSFIPNHYYPYSIQLYNLFSFKYINKLISPSLLALFSISRIRGYGKHKKQIEYTAIYNIYYQYYSFDDKRFVTYDELLNYVWTFN